MFHFEFLSIRKSLGFDLDAVFCKKSFNSRKRKPGFLHPVFFGIDRILNRRPKISLFQVGIVEEGTGKITTIEGGATQVGLRKINLLNGTFPEFGPFQA